MTLIERRKHVRHSCDLTVEVRCSGQTEALQATVADICLGGCYISTISPLPAGTTVLLCFGAEAGGATIAGRTVTCMPGSGMGIEFTGFMDAESADRLKSLIDFSDNDRSSRASA
jgi:PilZ domain-containing protein